ncbi:hypothetical protein NDU88_002320 [Pleurodeles waltl]|uniref:Uncharacterized protein n=1 Tax=Pleurodeles waltl TaxID=8319 RepID=A0AAV7UYJ3_PLEWA|nr:hypothetical protein NDU88_002320 [Pleurodeles waltl]
MWLCGGLTVAGSALQPIEMASLGEASRSQPVPRGQGEADPAPPGPRVPRPRPSASGRLLAPGDRRLYLSGTLLRPVRKSKGPARGRQGSLSWPPPPPVRWVRVEIHTPGRATRLQASSLSSPADAPCPGIRAATRSAMGRPRPPS